MKRLEDLKVEPALETRAAVTAAWTISLLPTTVEGTRCSTFKSGLPIYK